MCTLCQCPRSSSVQGQQPLTLSASGSTPRGSGGFEYIVATLEPAGVEFIAENATGWA